MGAGDRETFIALPLIERRGDAPMAKPQFSVLFNQSADIYSAIRSVVSHARNDGGVLDPTAVVRELVSIPRRINSPSGIA
jgi:hypothetical protein